MFNTLGILIYFILISFTAGYLIVSLYKYVGNKLSERFKFLNKLTSIESEEEFFLYPFLGMAALITILQNTNPFISSKLISIILTYIMVISLLILIMVIKKNPISNEKLIVISICMLPVFFILYPSFNIGLPTMYGGGDIAYYSSIQEWLKNNSYFTSPTYSMIQPFYMSAALHFSRFSRVGTDFFGIMPNSVFQVNPFNTFFISAAFYYLLIIFACYFLCFYVFKLPRKLAYFYCGLMALSFTIFSTLSHHMVPQTAGIAFIIMSIGLAYKVLFEMNRRYIFYFSIIFSGMLSVYSEFTAYVIIPVCLLVLYKVLSDFKNVKRIIAYGLIMSVGTILFNPISSYITFKYNLLIANIVTTTNDTEQFMTIIQRILMMFGFHEGSYAQPTALQYFIASILVVLLIIGAITLRKDILIFLAPFIFFYLFVFINVLHNADNHFLKNLYYSYWIFAFLLAFGIYQLFVKFKYRPLLIIGCIILCMIVGINIKNIILHERAYINSSSYLTEEFYDLKDISRTISKNDIIQVDGFDINQQHIIAYYLKDNKVIFNNPSDFFLQVKDNSIEGIKDQPVSYVIKRRNDIIKEKNEVIYSNGAINIFKINGQTNYDIKLSEGWPHYDIIWDNLPARWISKEASIEVSCRNESIGRLRFKAYLPPNKTSATLQIIVNGQTIDELNINSNERHYESKPINFTQKNQVKFVLKDLPAQSTSEMVLGLAFQEIEIY
ncbi:hypothetical protein [Paenibacillus sp. GYB003]|uniref:hypothetical protein n=1 Tax=Paenibacillus sp. GYB003 TaxID=2994392 RepID=UPI002F969E6C